MGYTQKILLTVSLACSSLLLFAQGNPHRELHDAFVLEQRGQFDEAIKIDKAAIDSGQLSGVELGRAYVMLGAAYHEEGNFTDAQAAFERSLHILERDREHVSDYAAALSNYARLYTDVNELDVARTMWGKAVRLDQKIGDHASAARALMDLAGCALVQKRAHEARDLLKRASDEMWLASDLVEDDFVLSLELQGLLALAERHPSAAVASFQSALELCLKTRGKEHWLTGWEYLLRGKAYAQAADVDSALADMRKGLAILDHALGHRNLKYFAAEKIYSQILDQAGSHAEAAQMRAASNEGSKDFYGRQCVECTISVFGFR